MKSIKIELKWAIIICILSFFWIGLANWLGFHSRFLPHEGWFSLLRMLLVIILLYYFLREKQINTYQDGMKWSDGFRSGIILSLLTVCIMPVALSLGYMLFSPDYFIFQSQYVIENQIMSAEQAKIALNMRTTIMRASFGGMMFHILACGVLTSYLQKKI